MTLHLFQKDLGQLKNSKVSFNIFSKMVTFTQSFDDRKTAQNGSVHISAPISGEREFPQKLPRLYPNVNPQKQYKKKQQAGKAYKHLLETQKCSTAYTEKHNIHLQKYNSTALFALWNLTAALLKPEFIELNLECSLFKHLLLLLHNAGSFFCL